MEPVKIVPGTVFPEDMSDDCLIQLTLGELKQLLEKSSSGKAGLPEQFWELSLKGKAPEPDVPVLPVLLEVKEWPGFQTGYENEELLSEITSLALELLPPAGQATVIGLREDILAVFLTGELPSMTLLAGNCKALVSRCRQGLNTGLCCCIGESTTSDMVQDMFERLVTLSRENVTAKEVLLLRFGVEEPSGAMAAPPIELWRELLYHGSYDQCLVNISDYLMSAMNAHRLSLEALRSLRHDLLQLFHGVLQRKGIPAHRVFDRERGDKLWSVAQDSLGELLDWVFWAVGEMASVLEPGQTKEDKLRQLQSYIKSNLRVEHSRKSLGELAHMSESSVARLFKSGTGCTVTEYVQQVRTDAAKTMLSETELSLGEIADLCGFGSYSYFYSRFKAITGQSPGDYRRQSSAKQLA